MILQDGGCRVFPSKAQGHLSDELCPSARGERRGADVGGTESFPAFVERRRRSYEASQGVSCLHMSGGRTGKLDDPFGGDGDADAPLANSGQCGDPGDRLGYSPNLRSQPPRLPSEMGVGWQHLFRMRLYVMGSVPSDDDRTCRDVRGEPLLAATAAEGGRQPLAFINPIVMRPTTAAMQQTPTVAWSRYRK